MAAPLPDIGLSLGTSIEEDNGVRVDRSADGMPATRELYDRSYYEIGAVYRAVTDAEQTTLTNFLRTHRNVTLEVQVKGITYHARLNSTVRVTPVGGPYSDVSFRLLGWRP